MCLIPQNNCVESNIREMAGAMNVSLKKFDMRKIQQDSVCVFIGRRRTGKSTLVKDLLFHHQDMPLGTVISAISPTDFPSNPLPIGEVTDIFPVFKSASLSATNVYFNSIPLA